jgi:antitoxin component YwqK of YwqJK toxin-antitoxin module
MKHTYSIIVVLIAFLGQAYGQTDTATSYNNLETRKFYSVSLYSKNVSGRDVYEVNGKRVGKQKFQEYQSTRKNIATCRPCILKSYDENENLIREMVSYSDCGVGWFRTYYTNGNLKRSGTYKENPTGDWNDIWNRGYCSVPNGQWTYFKENGDTLYSEFWDNGVFIKQVPEQSEVEIWDVEIQSNGQDAEKLAIPITNISNLNIKPKYKNSKTSDELTLTLEVSAIGHKMIEQKFTLESFKSIDVVSILLAAEIPNDKKANFVLTIYDADKAIKSVYLNVVR